MYENVAVEVLQAYFQKEILPQFEFDDNIDQWLDNYVNIDDRETRFFVSKNGVYYAFHNEDLWGSFEDVEDAIMSQNFMVDSFVQVKASAVSDLDLADLDDGGDSDHENQGFDFNEGDSDELWLFEEKSRKFIFSQDEDVPEPMVFGQDFALIRIRPRLFVI